MLSEIGQSEKDRYHMISLLRGPQWTKLTNQRQTHRSDTSAGTARGKGWWAQVVEGKGRINGHGWRLGFGW